MPTGYPFSMPINIARLFIPLQPVGIIRRQRQFRSGSIVIETVFNGSKGLQGILLCFFIALSSSRALKNKNRKEHRIKPAFLHAGKIQLIHNRF